MIPLERISRKEITDLAYKKTILALDSVALSLYQSKSQKLISLEGKIEIFYSYGWMEQKIFDHEGPARIRYRRGEWHIHTPSSNISFGGKHWSCSPDFAYLVGETLPSKEPSVLRVYPAQMISVREIKSPSFSVLNRYKR